MAQFPLPFAGIEFVVPMVDKEQLIRVLQFMNDGCGKGHMHNVAIQFDAPTPRIWTTDLGTKCIARCLGG